MGKTITLNHLKCQHSPGQCTKCKSRWHRSLS